MPQTLEKEPIVQEASELGLSPGIWPLTLWYDDKEWVQDRIVRTSNTLVSWIYVCRNDCDCGAQFGGEHRPHDRSCSVYEDTELHVLND